MELTSVLKIWREIVIVNLYVSVYHCENEKTDDLIAEGRMPSVGLKYVVSFTSQDDKHPVTNLISGDGYKKWLSHPKEKSTTIEAVFQLDQLCQISYLDVGSIWCATIEIQVGRSDWPAGREFETLVYTVSLMTPTECSHAKNTNKTQMFSSDLFCPGVAKQQYDRLKIICKQPYKKHIQFGLSFLRVKTTGTTPGDKKETSSAQKSASVKSIQKHFFGKMSNGLSSPQENLKTKLLKIAGTAENGADHDGSLSRPAKLVLAASGPKPKICSPEMKSPVTENRGMYSNCMEQKYGPKLEDEANEFFSNLKIEESELDKIMIADLRHSFERKKRRKLTKEEKKMFRDMAEKFISEKFGGNATEGEQNKKPVQKTEQNRKGVPNIVTKTPVTPTQENGPVATNQVNNSNANSKARVNEKPENSVSTKRQKVEVPAKPHQPVKRKLDGTEPTTPVTKLRKTDTILQKLKSPENVKPFAERTNIEPVKNKIDMPLTARQENSTPRGVFQYKGIRGGEELDLTQRQNMKTGVDKNDDFGRSEHVLFSPNCGRSPSGEADCSVFSSDDSLPDINIVAEQIEIESNDENIESVRGQGNGARGRGGRGRGRGSRGARGNNSTSSSRQDKLPRWMVDELDEMGRKMETLARDLDAMNQVSDAFSPERSTRGRGRGRGRGSGHGRGRGKKKNEAPSTPASTETSCRLSSNSPPRVPRGFTRCTGCSDVFGETLIAAHHQRCCAYKAKQNSTETCTSSNIPAKTSQRPYTATSTPLRSAPEPTGIGTSSPSIPRGRGRGLGRGRGSGNRTPSATGYTECEGCHDLFGNMMIERHRERCTPYQLMFDREDQSDTPPTTSCDSAACSVPPSTTTPRARRRGGQAGRGRGKKASCTASLETRPTGFAKCDGCNQYFGETLLAAHQQRCPSLKNKPKPLSSSESPWLSARPSDPVATPTPSTDTKSTPSSGSSASDRIILDNCSAEDTCENSISCEASCGDTCENSKTCCGGDDSDEEPEFEVRSPPWLLALHAAERRLEEQRLLQQSTAIINDTESCASTSCADNDTCSSILNRINRNSERQAFIDAQARQLEKLRAVEATTPAECLRSGSEIPSTSSCSFADRNSNTSSNARNQENARENTRGRCGANCSVDLTAESDDDDDDGENDDCNDDLDGFIVNDDDDLDDRADYNPGVPSQAFDDDDDDDDDDINANGERLIGRNILVECPLCGEYFPDMIIQFHAATCYL